MKFIQVPDWQSGSVDLVSRLQTALKDGRRVLWIVSGGSSIAVSVAVMQQLYNAPTNNLSILLSDERYGPLGHKDSNATQLETAGFTPRDAHILPVLIADSDLAATRQHYEAVTLEAFESADLIIGQLGIGIDGHIAGILPDSPAVTSTDFIAAYEAADYTRLTLTFPALSRLTVAYSFVFGNSKAQALQRLQETLDKTVQPAQVLKELPEAYVYNNKIGDQS